MSNPVFPLADQQDSRAHEMTPEDPALASDLEGGYVVSRARHTRAPRRTWSSGFTDITNEDKQTLEAFWDAVRGRSVIFDWRNPEDGETYQVRFKQGFKFKYVGIGTAKRWDVTFSVEQA